MIYSDEHIVNVKMLVYEIHKNVKKRCLKNVPEHVKCGCQCHGLFYFIGLWIIFISTFTALQAANYNYMQFNGHSVHILSEVMVIQYILEWDVFYSQYTLQLIDK